METFSFIDIYATKGIEYLIVIGFLASMILFYRYVIVGKKGKAHLTSMRWDPVMAYMKHPDEKAPEDKKASEAKQESGKKTQ